MIPKSSVSIVAPAFNEQDRIMDFIESIGIKFFQKNSNIDLRLLIINDGSFDNTESILAMAAEKHSWLHSISFTRNFGHQAAIVAGLKHELNKSDYIITMDSDLEHPVELLPEIISLALNGAAVVLTKRKSHEDLKKSKKIFSNLFYYILNKITDINLPSGGADFRCYQSAPLRQLSDQLGVVLSPRIIPSVICDNPPIVEYEQSISSKDTSSFTFPKNFKMALTILLRHSKFPMYLIFSIGLMSTALCLIYGAYIFKQYFVGQAVPGWSSIMLGLMFFGGLNTLSLVLIYLYMDNNIYKKDFPLY